MSVAEYVPADVWRVHELIRAALVGVPDELVGEFVEDLALALDPPARGLVTGRAWPRDFRSIVQGEGESLEVVPANTWTTFKHWRDNRPARQTVTERTPGEFAAGATVVPEVFGDAASPRTATTEEMLSNSPWVAELMARREEFTANGDGLVFGRPPLLEWFRRPEDDERFTNRGATELYRQPEKVTKPDETRERRIRYGRMYAETLGAERVMASRAFPAFGADAVRMSRAGVHDNAIVRECHLKGRDALYALLDDAHERIGRRALRAEANGTMLQEGWL